MLGIKGLLLNVFAILFFIPAFIFLFISLVVVMLPDELADLRNVAEMRIPQTVAESSTTQEMLEKEFPDDMTANEFSYMMIQFEQQCRNGEVDDEAEKICDGVLSGNIRTKNQLKDAYIDDILVPKMREGIRTFFTDIEGNFNEAGFLGGIPIIIFFVTFVIGCGFLFFNNMINPFKFVKSVGVYTFVFSLLILIMIFLLWMITPGLVDGFTNHVESEYSDGGADERVLMGEVLDVTGEIVVDWGRGFLQKLMMIFGGLAVVGFAVNKF